MAKKQFGYIFESKEAQEKAIDELKRVLTTIQLLYVEKAAELEYVKNCKYHESSN
nr:MAG: hypothetical protein [Microvirus sp.]